MTRTHLMGGLKNGKRNHFYCIWKKMRQRCLNPNDPKFVRYGKRGIKICDRWDKFENFRDDMLSTWSEGLSIERIDNNGDYEPNNCKWIPKNEQAKNRESNVRITLNGVTKNKIDWARYYKINRCTVNFRLGIGMNIKEALTKPIRKPLEFCHKGHMRTRVGGNGKWYCKLCFNSYQRERYRLSSDRDSYDYAGTEKELPNNIK